MNALLLKVALKRWGGAGSVGKPTVAVEQSSAVLHPIRTAWLPFVGRRRAICERNAVMGFRTRREEEAKKIARGTTHDDAVLSMSNVRPTPPRER